MIDCELKELKRNRKQAVQPPTPPGIDAQEINNKILQNQFVLEICVLNDFQPLTQQFLLQIL